MDLATTVVTLFVPNYVKMKARYYYSYNGDFFIKTSSIEKLAGIYF